MFYIKLDKASKQALSQQLVESFEKAIDQLLLLPEQRLPSEENLCESFGISRSVVQIAYNLLEDKKLIKRNPKGGTFVAQNARYQEILNQVPFFVEALIQSKVKFYVQTNVIENIETVQHLKYTTIIEGIPMILTEAWVNKDLPLLEPYEFRNLLNKSRPITEFKSVVIDKQRALFFNQSGIFAAYYFSTIFNYNDLIVAQIEQWVSPTMGNLRIEVSNEL